jgi:ubiquinone/menaquinone biosynthesis C-methylase UbiE
MTNPWLDIPEADYVGHMDSPGVGQRPVLSRLLGEALDSVRPRVVLVVGGSNGNGLEHVDPAATSRVVVVDINPAYLRCLRERFPRPGFELVVRTGDVLDIELELEAYDLVHAALIFEYVDWPALLPRLARALRPGGVLSVILQSPSASTPAVTPTAFTSLRKLESLFRFVEPMSLVDSARAERLSLNARHVEPLPAGKSFDVLRFMKDADLESS